MESKEWDGSGLPPVGAECEYLWADGKEWRKCEIVAYYLANVVAVDVLDSTAVCMLASLFRPIKTPEQIAREERDEAIEEMVELLIMHGKTMRGDMRVLYDAGYRKTEVKK